MDFPKISIVIPFFNEESSLTDAVDSVLSQSYLNTEIILVDDGSTDNSNKTAEKICSENQNCKLFSIENSGPGIARNVGIDKATGKYICFLDADDLLVKDALLTLYKDLIKSKSDLSIGMHKMLDSNEKTIKISRKNNQIVHKDEAINLVVSRKIIPVSWAKLYKTEIVKQCNFPDLSWKEDDVFLLQYLQKMSKVSIINKIVLINNCKAHSLTRQTISGKMVLDIMASYTMQKKLITKENKTELLNSEIETLINLLLIYKIDKRKILKEEKRKIIKYINNQFLKNIYRNDNVRKLSFKKKFLLFFIKNSIVFGVDFINNSLSFVKNKQFKKLKQIKT